MKLRAAMDIGRQLGENRGVPRRLLALALLLACGPGSAEPTTTTSMSSTGTGGTSTSAADPTEAPGTDTSATGTSTSSTSTSTSTSSTSTSSTSTSTSTSTTGDTDSTTGDTGTSTSTGDTTTGGEDVAYAAYFWAGGLDHLLIHRADFGEGRCATLHLAWPGGADPSLQISAPDGWAPVNAAIADSTAGCLEGMPMGAQVAASGGAGVVSWPPDPNQICPPSIDVDLVLDFPPDQPWVPAQVPMLVTALPVSNCP